MWIIKIIKIKCFFPPRILNKHWCIYSCLQSPPWENWLHNVRRVYATAINFPWISTLGITASMQQSLPNCGFLWNVSYKDLNSTVVNRTWPSLNWGSLDVTMTITLIKYNFAFPIFRAYSQKVFQLQGVPRKMTLDEKFLLYTV